MSVSFATGELGFSQGPKKISLNYSDGDFVCNAGEDNDIQGTALSYRNGEYIFEDNYVYLTLFVNCDWNEFVTPGLFKLIINGDTIFQDQNMADGEYIYGSRSKDFSRNDSRVLLHFNIPASKIYDSRITSIRCSCSYGVGWGESISGYWEVPNCTVYQTYYWENVGGDGYWKSDWRLRNYNKYSNAILAPQDYYNGSVELLSCQNDGNFNKDFFTEEHGEIIIRFNLEHYLSEDQYRIPQSCRFYGINKTTMEEEWSNRIYPIDPNSENYHQKTLSISKTYDYKIDSTILSKFSEISEVEIKMGPHFFTKTVNTIKNSDILDNVPIEFSISKNVNNEYVSMTNDQVTLKSTLSGSLILSQNCPYIFFDQTGAILANKNSNKTMTISISSKDGKPSINEEIQCTLIPNGEKTSLEYQEINKTLYEAGDYLLTCQIKNKLIVKEGETTNTTETFNVKNLCITTDDSKYVSLKQIQPSIKYEKENVIYHVPGNILMPWEYMSFENDYAEPFYLFNLSSFKRKETTPKCYLIINSQETVLEVSKDVKHYYNVLKNPSNSRNTDTQDTVPFQIKYKFENLNVYSSDYSFVLGRKAPVRHSITKIEEAALRYYLTDNGGDQNLTINDSILSTNQLIEQRKANKIYFNLARQPNEQNFLHEQLVCTFTPINPEKKSVSCKIQLTSENLPIMLDFLKEDKVNTIPFNLDFWQLDEEKYTREDFFNVLNEEMSLKIELFYVYDVKIDKTDVKELLFVIEEPNLSFIQRLSPLGLRKNGVIINPEKEQDLDNNNTFIINVKDITKKTDESSKWNAKNGLKIVFQTDELNANLPIFEIFLDENGQICFSNGSKTFKPFG